jgi:hypothetical protein
MHKGSKQRQTNKTKQGEKAANCLASFFALPPKNNEKLVRLAPLAACSSAVGCGAGSGLS